MNGEPVGTVDDTVDDVAAVDAARRHHWVNHIARHAHQQPDAPALRWRGATTTWSVLHYRVERLAAALHRRGVRAGERVAVVMSNCPEFLEAVFAANRLGAIAVPVNSRLTAVEIAHVLQDSGAVVVAADDAFTTVVADAVARTGSNPSTVTCGGPDAQWEAWVDEPGSPAPAVDVAETEPALIMYTSGTTGRPKGAVLTHQNLQGQALTIVRAWRLVGDDEVNLCASPLFHIGAIGSVVPLVLVGGCTVIHPSGNFDAAEVLGVLADEAVTSVFLVPTQWQALCDLPVRSLPSLRTTAWGAAPASTTLLRAMAEHFPEATNVALFGQTETSPVTCVLDGRDALRKIGSVGRPISTLAVRVVDAAMADVPVGGVGEIVYRGPTVMAGYWRDPEATREAFAGGWFHSGDLVRVDEDGFHFVVDRKKDMIISGGENVYCAEVEEVLAAHPAIREVSVVGRPHPRWGETPVAVVALVEPGTALPVAGVRAWAAERLAGYKLPTVVEVVDALPRNATGKVVKGVLRERFGATTVVEAP